MKKAAVFIMCCIFALTLLASCKSEDESSQEQNALTGSIVTFENVEKMRAASPADGTVIELLGYYNINDGAAGTFWFDASSVLEDNGGTVIAPDGGSGRYIRLCEKNVLNVKMFGAKGSGTSDDTAAFQNALTALDNGGTLTVPGGEYIITAPLTVNVSGISICGDGTVTVTANAAMESVVIAKDVNDLTVSDITVACNKKAQNGIMLENVTGASLTSVSVKQFVVAGLSLNGVRSSTFSFVSAYTTSDGASPLSAFGGSEYDLFSTCTF
ncbi:MAG TPA: glycosyl hydrolase family 28-related protein, partial [Bacillota bacterium]|nr:glycosyl hydrolase family 28-related protein [Bacillota bacterium]